MYVYMHSYNLYLLPCGASAMLGFMQAEKVKKKN